MNDPLLSARVLRNTYGRGARYLLAPSMYNIMYIWRWGMKVVSMSESRANYAATLDSVINDQEEVVITRPGGENVVMLPQREYESMRETLYLMASPANRRRISRSIEQLNDGGGRKLAELDEQIARAQAVREAIRHGLLCPALRALRSRISDDGVVNIFHGHADKVVQPRDVHGDLHIG